MNDVLRLENVTRLYKEGERELEVFSGLNMNLKPGEIVALVGPSGAGKSSLLHMAGLLEAPTSEADLPHKLERAYFGHDVATPLHR